jgi:hypothetical protein
VRRSLLKAMGLLAAALASIPLVFALSLTVLYRLVQAEYRSGARTSTAGDIVMIPAVYLTMLSTIVLATVVVATALVRWVRSRRGARA